MKYSQVSGVNYARNRRQLSAGSSLELIHNPKKNLIPAVHSGVIKKKNNIFSLPHGRTRCNPSAPKVIAKYSEDKMWEWREAG